MVHDDVESMPAHSLEGNAHLVLEDGSKVKAHSLYLAHASSVFKGALACSQQAELRGSLEDADSGKSDDEHRNDPVKLPLPGVSKMQAQLLVTCLYTMGRETWLDSLRPPRLIQLAKVAHNSHVSASLM